MNPSYLKQFKYRTHDNIIDHFLTVNVFATIKIMILSILFNNHDDIEKKKSSQYHTPTSDDKKFRFNDLLILIHRKKIPQNLKKIKENSHNKLHHAPIVGLFDFDIKFVS